MKKIFDAICFLALGLVSTASHGGEGIKFLGNAPFLYDIDQVLLELNFEIGEDCLPHPELARRVVATALNQSGFKVIAESDSLFVPTIQVDVLGLLNGDICAVYVRGSIVMRLIDSVPWVSTPGYAADVDYTVPLQHVMFQGPKNEVQNYTQIEIVEGTVEQLRLIVAKAKGIMEKQYPEVLKEMDKAKLAYKNRASR